jgi:hypothetical protein
MNIKNKHQQFFFIGLAILSSFCVFTSSAYAATIGLNINTAHYNVGDSVAVKVYINSNVQSVNAISATVSFPADLLTLHSISKSGSIINLWAQDPTYSNTTGKATFEGVILKGYTGSSGTAVTLNFKAKSSGEAHIKFTTASILANDGIGTEVLSGTGTATLTISNKEITKTAIPASIATITKKPVEIVILTTPTIPNLKDIYVNERLILDGIADPLVDVQLKITNISTNEVFVSHVETNSDGRFTYVSESSLSQGSYFVTAVARNTDGITSAIMNPAVIHVTEHLFNSITTKIMNYANTLVSLVALVGLCIALAFYIHLCLSLKKILKQQKK